MMGSLDANGLTLGIETSCDDTSVALVRAHGYVEVCVAANQDLVHQPFGGVVPEIASRNHTMQLLPLIEQVREKFPFEWSQLMGIAVTSRPGLIGSLLVGVMTAKTLAHTFGTPLIGVNHLEGHLLAPFLYDDRWPKPEGLKFPFLALAVSGGHTQIYWVAGVGQYRVLGRTIDDAAGEALDKFAKFLGMGFPGGKAIDDLAKSGNPKAFRLPRTMAGDESYNFSFSGLKSAAIRMVEQMSESDRLARRADLCASYQEAVVESLMLKLSRAATDLSVERVVLSGGVTANSRLRKVAEDWAQDEGVQLFVPPIRYCTDNAAMIAYAGAQRLLLGERSDFALKASAGSLSTDFFESSR